MKELRLEKFGKKIILPADKHDQIAQLVELYRVCEPCEKPYSDKNPRVGLNLCLSCFMTARTHLSYIGTMEGHHVFKDMSGTIYQVIDDRPDACVYLTLKYWKFPVEDSYKGYHWYIYGNVRNKVVVVAYESHNSEYAFILRRDGCREELDRRRNPGRALFAEAKKRLNLLPSQLTNEKLYKEIAKILNEKG